MYELYFQGQAPYKGNSEPRGTGGFADTTCTPDAELCGVQWLSYLFRSSLQVSNYFEVLGNYDDTQWENMKYSRFFYLLWCFLGGLGFFVCLGFFGFFTKPSSGSDSSPDLGLVLLPGSWNDNCSWMVQIMNPSPWSQTLCMKTFAQSGQDKYAIYILWFCLLYREELVIL